MAKHGGIELGTFKPQTPKPRTGPGIPRTIFEPPTAAFNFISAPLVTLTKPLLGSELPFSVSLGLLAELECRVKVIKSSSVNVDGLSLEKVEFKATSGPNLTGYWLIKPNRSVYRARATFTTDTGHLGASGAPVPVAISFTASQML